MTGEAKVILTSRTHYFRDKFEVDKILKKQGVEGLSQHATMLLREVYDKPEYEIVYLKEFTPDQVKEYLVKALKNKWQEGEKSIHYKALSDVLSRYLKSKIKTSRDLEHADYEVRTASFLVRDDEGNYDFAHNSFQEFFIARKIKKELEKQNYNVLDLRRLSMEIIFFLRHLIDDDEKIIQPMCMLLSQEYKKNISENVLLLFYTVIKMSCLDQRFSLNETVEFTGKEAEAFRECLKENLPGKINLKTAVLSGTALSRMVFIKTDISEADMENAVLTHSTFEGVTFKQTNLKYSDFSHSVFINVTFERTDAQYCNFRNCIFENCSFSKSGFRLSNFESATFKGCVIEENDFTGTGFLSSNLDLKVRQKNTFFGTGKPGTRRLELNPLLTVGHSYRVNAVAISKDNRYIVSGSYDNTVKLWDLYSGALLNTLEGHKALVSSVAVSADNRRLVSGSDDKTVKLWDLETGRLVNTLKGHYDYVVSVTFSPDNRRVVSGSYDNTMKIWDIQSGELIYSISLLPGNNVITLFKNNQYLASSDTALQYLYYTDGLARYPARDLPELRFRKTDE